MLLLVLLMMNSDENSKETLQSLLRFYRENKDVIASLLNAQKSGEMRENPEDITQNPPEEAEKSRPHEEVGDTRIIEEYLKRFSV